MAIKVLIVDDSGFFRRRLKEIFSTTRQFEIVGMAENGRDAVDKTLQLSPDVITMDYEMPVMDGISAVKEIMSKKPTPILMFSSLTYESAKITLDALQAGAVDFLPKNFEEISRNSSKLRRSLFNKLKAVAKSSKSTPSPVEDTNSSANPVRSSLSRPLKSTAKSDTVPTKISSNSALDQEIPQRLTNVRKQKVASSDNSLPTKPSVSTSAERLRRIQSPQNQPSSGKKNSTQPEMRRDTTQQLDKTNGKQKHFTDVNKSLSISKSSKLGRKALRGRCDVIIIGTSTGGPAALTSVLTELPSNFPIPIVLVQHMPGNFTKAFAERLDSLCHIKIREAKNGDSLDRGVALLAPGGMQLMIDKQKRVRVLPGDNRVNYKPCVDITFGSAANIFGSNVLGMVLTGMGSDGRDGSRLLKNRGATIWAQDEASCLIYGMPMAVVNANLADEVIGLSEMADRLIGEFCR